MPLPFAPTSAIRSPGATAQVDVPQHRLGAARSRTAPRSSSRMGSDPPSTVGPAAHRNPACPSAAAAPSVVAPDGQMRGSAPAAGRVADRPSASGSQTPACSDAFAGSRQHLRGRPDVDRAPVGAERQHHVRERPRERGAMLHQHDRRGPLRAQRGQDPAPPRPRRRDRGSPWARRAPAAPAPAPARPAIATRCCSPPDSRFECRPSNPASPTAASASGTRARIATSGQRRFSRPKATSSPTRSMTSWLAGSWSTIPAPDLRSSTARTGASVDGATSRSSIADGALPLARELAGQQPRDPASERALAGAGRPDDEQHRAGLDLGARRPGTPAGSPPAYVKPAPAARIPRGGAAVGVALRPAGSPSTPGAAQRPLDRERAEGREDHRRDGHEPPGAAAGCRSRPRRSRSTQSWTHAPTARSERQRLPARAPTSAGSRTKAKTSSAAAPWTKPESSVSGPHWLPSSAETPAATISAKRAAPGLRMMSGARIAGTSHIPYTSPAARRRDRSRGPRRSRSRRRTRRRRRRRSSPRARMSRVRHAAKAVGGLRAGPDPGLSSARWPPFRSVYERRRSPIGRTAASSVGLLPSPVRAGSGSGGSVVGPHSQRVGAPRRRCSVAAGRWYRGRRRSDAGRGIRLTRSRIQSSSSATTCGPGDLVVELVAEARVDLPRHAGLALEGLARGRWARSRRRPPWTTSVGMDRRSSDRRDPPLLAERRMGEPNGRLVLVERIRRRRPRRRPGRTTGRPGRGGWRSRRPGATRRSDPTSARCHSGIRAPIAGAERTRRSGRARPSST